MSTTTNADAGNKTLFWGCFIALITTAFAFITRAFLINIPDLWPSDFGLNSVQAQELFGAGIWPFAISIIAFSLIIDRIGYRVAMIFSFVCYVIYAALALKAYGMVNATGLEGDALKAAQGNAYNYLYWGSVILGLGNGTVEAFINPVVATMYKREKTKWLNILHAGWPGGLVLGGVITIAVGSQAAADWRILIYLIAAPAVVYLVMLLKQEFPVNERVASGTSYKEMLAEFGVIGAFIAFFLIFKQLGGVFAWSDTIVYAVTGASVVAYGLYCQSLGRPILILLCLVMMPLATTELGTDGAITGIMEGPMKEAGFNPLWVLIYTSAIMAILRFFFAGPIVEKLTPIGLLAASAALAIIGLFLLASAEGLVVIFACATLYGLGKTFFWPTTLGVVSEQCPKGGALTLNAIAGIGMLTVGIVGGPLIGKMQEDSAKSAIEAKMEGTYAKISEDKTYILGDYTAVSDEKLKTLSEGQQGEVSGLVKQGKQAALANVTVFPMIMLISYVALGFYFKGRGGYKAVELDGEDENTSESSDIEDDDSADSGDEESGGESDEESKDD
jgi:MFS family permease